MEEDTLKERVCLQTVVAGGALIYRTCVQHRARRRTATASPQACTRIVAGSQPDHSAQNRTPDWKRPGRSRLLYEFRNKYGLPIGQVAEGEVHNKQDRLKTVGMDAGRMCLFVGNKYFVLPFSC